jgi:hypothetical protein
LLAVVTLSAPLDKLCVSAMDYERCSKLNVKLPWIKVTLLLLQYFAQKEATVPAPGGKSYGAQLSPADFERLTKVPIAVLLPVETFLRGALQVYSRASMPWIVVEEWWRELPALFVRTGKLLLLTKEYALDTSFSLSLAKIEAKMRAKLVLDTSIAVVLHEALTVDLEEAKAKKTVRKIAVIPDVTPAPNFGPDGVLDDFISKARALGFVVGAQVRTNKVIRGVKKHAQGVITAIGAELSVQFEELSLIDESDTDQKGPPAKVTFSSLDVVVPEKSKKKIEDVAPAAEPIVPEGIPWVSNTPACSQSALNGLLASALYQMYMAHAPAAEDIRFVYAHGERGIVTARALKRGSLKFFPFASDMQLARAGNREKRPGLYAEVDFGGSKEKVFFPQPTSDAMSKLSDDSTVIVPFWWLLNATAKDPSQLMLHKIGEWQLPLCHFTTKDKGIRIANGQKDKILKVLVPYYTNDEELEKGTWLSI